MWDWSALLSLDPRFLLGVFVPLVYGVIFAPSETPYRRFMEILDLLTARFARGGLPASSSGADSQGSREGIPSEMPLDSSEGRSSTSRPT